MTSINLDHYPQPEQTKLASPYPEFLAHSQEALPVLQKKKPENSVFFPFFATALRCFANLPTSALSL
jgi:hypothetical protein